MISRHKFEHVARAIETRTERATAAANDLTPVALACGHSTGYPKPLPLPSQSAYCRTCSTYTTVIEETTNA